MSLASDAGIDTTVCELCERPLVPDDPEDDEPWVRGMDGCGAHVSCLRGMGIKTTLAPEGAP